MHQINLTLPIPARKEDYTGTVCLLHKVTKKTPVYHEVLIDIEDFDRVIQHEWLVHWMAGGGYRCVKAGARKRERHMYLHRFILDAPGDKFVDHKRHNALDNRRSQIRLCDHRLNCINSRRLSGSSRFRGVSWNKRRGKWAVIVGSWRLGRYKFLGYFADEIDAARAYNAFAVAEYGEFAYLNPV